MTRLHGKFRGKVVLNEDPKHLGRLKVTVPAVLGNLAVWARPASPYAGNKVGFYSLPAEDDAVWIEFEGGNPSNAVWVGGWWANDELPHEDGPQARVWQTDSTRLRLKEPDSEDGDPSVLLEVIEGASILIEGDEVHVDAGGSTIDMSSSSVEISASNASTIELGNTAKINGTSLEVQRD